jgi:hypothetical protein
LRIIKKITNVPFFLVFPSGMVETPRLQGKGAFSKFEKSIEVGEVGNSIKTLGDAATAILLQPKVTKIVNSPNLLDSLKLMTGFESWTLRLNHAAQNSPS